MDKAIVNICSSFHGRSIKEEERRQDDSVYRSMGSEAGLPEFEYTLPISSVAGHPKMAHSSISHPMCYSRIFKTLTRPHQDLEAVSPPLESGWAASTDQTHPRSCFVTSETNSYKSCAFLPGPLGTLTGNLAIIL